MRNTNVSDIKTTGGFGGQKIAMQLDPNSTAHLMSLLSNPYSDLEGAILREISTNSHDSHVEAGVTRPIEVTLPSGLSPYLKIKDYGVGLSVDDIINIYSQYGASTKRDSDDFNGILGIGSKSPLAYTDQFTVIAVKNGVKATVIVSKTEDGTGEMEVIDTCAVTESNGVGVTIPAKPGNRFAEKAQAFFSYWPAGSVLVNGKEPARLQISMINDTIGIVKGRHTGDKIVMGNVAYPAPTLLDVYRSNYGTGSFDIVAFVDIGDVHFVPSREELSDTKLTRATVDKIRAEVKAGLPGLVEREINTATTYHEALRMYLRWTQLLGSSYTRNLNYNGIEFPSYFKIKGQWHNLTAQGRNNGSRHTDSSISTHDLHTTVFFTGYDKVKINKAYRDKLTAFMSDKDIKHTLFILLSDDVDTTELFTWVDPSHIFNWKDVKAIKLNTGPVIRSKPTIRAFDPAAGLWVSDSTLDTTKIPVYVSPTVNMGSSTADNYIKLFPETQLVELGQNRWEKFSRENPGAVHYGEYKQRKINEARDALTPDDLLWLSISDTEKMFLQKLSPADIDDPVLKEIITLCNQGYKSDTLSRYLNLGGYSRVEVVKYLEDYPLVAHQVSWGMSNPKHVTCYINAAYHTFKENSN